MIAPLLLAASAVLLLVGLFAGQGGGKAKKRRLEAVRARYVSGNPIETQLRRIAAQQGNRLDDNIHRLLPNPELLRRRIAAAGKSWTLGRYAMACGLIALAVTVLLLWRGAPFLLAFFLGLVAGIGLPHFYVGLLARRRIQKFLLLFPDAIELLVRGLRSGLPVSETLQVVGGEIPDPVGVEFRGVADKMRIGRTMEAALQETADRLSTAEFQFFTITLAIQRETGGNLAETLSNLADVLRKRLQMKLKIKAMSSESKASAYIIGALPFLIFAMIMVVNPGYGGKFFTDTRLIMAACGAGVWMSIGVLIMAKMINFEI